MSFCLVRTARCEAASTQAPVVAPASKRASNGRHRLPRFNRTLTSRQTPLDVVDRRRRQLCVCSAQAQSSEVRVLELVRGPPGAPILFFIPGLDGTGIALHPHLDDLASHGLSVQSLYIPPCNRQNWDSLTATTVPLVRAAAADAAPNPLIFVAESFGACLALRVLLAAPDAASKLVLINSATSFNLALLGVPGLVADTGFLSLFNSPLYSVSKAVFLPFLLDQRQATGSSSHLLNSMFTFTPAEPRLDLFASPPKIPRSAPPTPQHLPHHQHQQQQASISKPSSLNGSNASTQALPSNRSQTQSSNTRSRRTNNNSSYEWPLSSLQALIPSDDAACTSFRIRLLRTGAPSDRLLRTILVPTLIVSSAQDRLLPSKYEGDRLDRILPHSKCIVLPRSGHAPLLERNVNFLRLLIRARVLPSTPFKSSSPEEDGPPPQVAKRFKSTESAEVHLQYATTNRTKTTARTKSTESTESADVHLRQRPGEEELVKEKVQQMPHLP